MLLDCWMDNHRLCLRYGSNLAMLASKPSAAFQGDHLKVETVRCTGTADRQCRLTQWSPLVRTQRVKGSKPRPRATQRPSRGPRRASAGPARAQRGERLSSAASERKIRGRRERARGRRERSLAGKRPVGEGRRKRAVVSQRCSAVARVGWLHWTMKTVVVWCLL